MVGGSRPVPVRPDRLTVDILRQRGHLRQQQQLHFGNPPAPQGVQVAFIQEAASFTQSVANWAAGSYVLNFDAAQRATSASQQDFNVLVDGDVVGTFTPSGTSYQTYSTTTFTVTAGTHTIKFQGLNSAGGDNTVFIDGRRAGQSIADHRPGFRAGVGGRRQVPVRPERLPLDLRGRRRPHCQQQRLHIGQPTRTGGLAGSLPPAHRLVHPERRRLGSRFVRAVLRGCPAGHSQASRQDFKVLVDGAVVGTFTPSGTTYQSYTTAAFTAAAGSHTIVFQGLDTAGGDNTAFVDQILAVL